MGVCGCCAWWPAPTCGFLFILSDILNELFQRENRVLHYWTMRKRRLDQCQQYVVFERSAKQVSHHTALPVPSPRAQASVVRRAASDVAAGGKPLPDHPNSLAFYLTVCCQKTPQPRKSVLLGDFGLSGCAIQLCRAAVTPQLRQRSARSRGRDDLSHCKIIRWAVFHVGVLISSRQNCVLRINWAEIK